MEHSDELKKFKQRKNNLEISDSEHVKIYEKFVEEIIDRLKKY